MPLKLNKRIKPLINRLGAKDNDIKYFLEYMPENVNKVIEPFGGSFAVIRRVYNDDKYEKIVCDIDDEIFYVYEKPEQLLNDFKILNDEIKNNSKRYVNENVKDGKLNLIGKLIKDFIINNNLIKNKDYIIKNCLVFGNIFKPKVEKEGDLTKSIEFMKKIKFLNINGMEILDKHSHEENTFIFLDPPYLFSDNSSYTPLNKDNKEHKDINDMTKILCDLIDIFKNKETKAKIMLIINDLYIIRWIFKDYIKGTYSKTYNYSRKKNKHLIIFNYIKI